MLLPGEEAVREALTEAFGAYGEVANIRLPTDRESGEMKGIGFIEFTTAEAKVGGKALGLVALCRARICRSRYVSGPQAPETLGACCIELRSPPRPSWACWASRGGVLF